MSLDSTNQPVIPNLNNPLYCSQQIDTISTKIATTKKIDESSAAQIQRILTIIENNFMKDSRVASSMQNLLARLNELPPSDKGAQIIEKIKYVHTNVLKLPLDKLPLDAFVVMSKNLDAVDLKATRLISRRTKQMSDIAMVQMLNSEHIPVYHLGLSKEGIFKLFETQGAKIKFCDLVGLDLTPQEIIDLIKKCPNIEHIGLGNELPEEEMKTLLQNIVAEHPGLKSVDLSREYSLTDDHLAPLAGLSQLESLNFSNLYRANGSFLAYLTGMTMLKTLNISNSTSLQSLDLLKNLKSLVSLDLGECYLRSDNLLAPLTNLTQLENLNLTKNPDLNGACLSYLTGLSKLRTLNLNDCIRITEGLSHLNNLTNLETLKLAQCVSLDSQLAFLANLTKLQTLELNNNGTLNGSCLAYISGLTGLKSLNLSGCIQMEQNYLIHLKDLAKLETLHLLACNALLTEGLGIITGLSKLKFLDLSQTYNNALVGISALKNLETLELRSRLGSGVSLEHLIGLTKLRKLNLYRNWIHDNELAILTNIQSLRALSLTMCNDLTDQALTHVAALKNLEELYLGVTRMVTSAGLAHICSPNGLTKLKSLSLQRNMSSDADLAPLSHLNRLEQLNLANCKNLTPACLTHLKVLKNLRKLNITGTDKIKIKDADTLKKTAKEAGKVTDQKEDEGF